VKEASVSPADAGGFTLSFASTLPNHAATPGKDTHQECQHRDEEAEERGVNGPRPIKAVPDQKSDPT